MKRNFLFASVADRNVKSRSNDCSRIPSTLLGVLMLAADVLMEEFSDAAGSHKALKLLGRYVFVMVACSVVVGDGERIGRRAMPDTSTQ